MDVPRRLSVGDASDGTPPLWQLNEANQSTDSSKLLQSIAFLQANPAWVEANLEQAKERFTLLAATDLSAETEPTKKARCIQDTLRNTYPALFPPIPTIKIKVMDNDNKTVIAESEIPLNLLTEKSAKFNKIFSYHLKEKGENQLEFHLREGIDKSVYKEFLSYLETGKVNLTSDNVLPLLELAHEHMVEGITYNCCEYLTENLEASQLITVLEKAIQLNHDDLRWVCLIVSSKESTDEECGKVFQSMNEIFAHQPTLEQLADFKILTAEQKAEVALIEDKAKAKELAEAMHILNVGIFCKILEFDPSFVEHARTVSLNTLNEGNLFILQFLRPFIQGLRMTDLDPSLNGDEFLEQCATIVQNPDLLIINDGKIKTIPQGWQASLKFLDCSRCGSLEELNLSSAKKINCTDTFSLRKLNAPLAETIISNGFEDKDSPTFCWPLETLYAPSVQEIDFRGFPVLRSLTVSRNCKLVGEKPFHCELVYG